MDSSKILDYVDVPKPESPEILEPDFKLSTNPTIEQFIYAHRKDPDIKRIPLPESFYEKYNIPKPEPLTLNTYLFKSMKSCISGGIYSDVEIREPDSKGVRKMPFLSTVEAFDLSGNPTTYLSSFTE